MENVNKITNFLLNFVIYIIIYGIKLAKFTIKWRGDLLMNRIFGGMILFSFLFAAATGRLDALSRAALEQAGVAVAVALELVGMLCLWGGLMRIAQKAGLSHFLAKALSPLTRRLFHGLHPEGAAMNAVTMNLVANLLGLGNAATPLGIAAVRAMQQEQNCGATASNDMALFVVLNTASIQLIPTTTALLRMRYGASMPLDILPAVWGASAAALVVGIAMARLLETKRGAAR